MGLQEGGWEGLFLKEDRSHDELKSPPHSSRLYLLHPGKYLMSLQLSCALRPSPWSCC